ncbi:MAG: tetratricopeptide repeat protein [Gemmatimonadota bacterium]
MIRSTPPVRLRSIGAAVSALLVLAACGGDEDTSRRQPIGGQGTSPSQGQMPDGHPEVPGMEGGGAPGTDERDLPPALAVRLDSGNTAYRAGEFEKARRHFRAAVQTDSTEAAGWFGVYMAERALGNEVAADSALRRAGGLGDASGMHGAPDEDSAGGGMPHPPMEIPEG